MYIFSGGTKFMLLASFGKHPSRSTADHISKSVLCGRCGAVNYRDRLPHGKNPPATGQPGNRATGHPRTPHQPTGLQLSPSIHSIRLKAFGGWKFDRGRTQLRARILRRKGVHRKKSGMFTGGSSISATFVLPVRDGTGVALQRKRMGISQNPQSTTGT